jgi:hypothetical protein
MRIEHWDVAAQQGTTAALNMLGQHQPFQEVPYFFSGLFDIWLEYLGYAPARVWPWPPPTSHKEKS